MNTLSPAGLEWGKLPPAVFSISIKVELLAIAGDDNVESVEVSVLVVSVADITTPA